MKKIALPLLVLLLINSAFSQWSQISTVNTSQLNAVKFFNELTGITAGVGGIWRSTNSGVNWTQVLSGVNMNSVSFPDINTGYAVGDSCKIFKTSINGLNWSEQLFPATKNLYSVSFFNTGTGFAVGQDGIILKTNNGGTSWNQNINPIAEDLNYVQMVIDYQTAFAVGGIIRELFTSTANGGVNWINSWQFPNSFFRSASSIPNLYGPIYTVGQNGKIMKTTNFGAYWTTITNPANQTLNCIIFNDTSTGYIVGNQGWIMKSTTGGNNWMQQLSFTSNNLRCVSFINSQTGWVVGQNGIVLRTGIPVGIVETENNIPTDICLYQNYPNPFNPITKIKFEIPKTMKINFLIYDILGREVKKLINNEMKQAGRYVVEFDGTNYASGVYFYRIEAGTFVQSKKMVLIK